MASYAENRRLLTEGLGALGYEFVEPDGAFYLWVRALEDDAQAPISALRAMPYANSSRIALGSAPSPYILSFTMCTTSSSSRLL